MDYLVFSDLIFNAGSFCQLFENRLGWIGGFDPDLLDHSNEKSTFFSERVEKRVCCLVIVLIFYGVLIIYFDEPSSYRPLLDTVIEQQKVIVQDTGSLTVRFALEISTFKDGFQLWLIQHLGQFGKIWPQLLGILGGVIIFFNAIKFTIITNVKYTM